MVSRVRKAICDEWRNALQFERSRVFFKKTGLVAVTTRSGCYRAQEAVIRGLRQDVSDSTTISVDVSDWSKKSLKQRIYDTIAATKKKLVKGITDSEFQQWDTLGPCSWDEASSIEPELRIYNPTTTNMASELEPAATADSLKVLSSLVESHNNLRTPSAPRERPEWLASWIAAERIASPDDHTGSNIHAGSEILIREPPCTMFKRKAHAAKRKRPVQSEDSAHEDEKAHVAKRKRPAQPEDSAHEEDAPSSMPPARPTRAKRPRTTDAQEGSSNGLPDHCLLCGTTVSVARNIIYKHLKLACIGYLKCDHCKRTKVACTAKPGPNACEPCRRDTDADPEHCNRKSQLAKAKERKQEDPEWIFRLYNKAAIERCPGFNPWKTRVAHEDGDSDLAETSEESDSSQTAADVDDFLDTLVPQIRGHVLSGLNGTNEDGKKGCHSLLKETADMYRRERKGFTARSIEVW